MICHLGSCQGDRRQVTVRRQLCDEYVSKLEPTVGLGDRGAPGLLKLLPWLHEFILCTGK